jgi:hypothetical protein
MTFNAYPDVNPQCEVAGHRILIQLKRVPNKIGSIILADSTREIDQYKCRVGRVIKTGPLAYADRKTGDLWKAGAWCKVGDFVQIPPQGGVKFDRSIDPTNPNSPDRVEFIIVNDENILAVFDNEEATFD